jgi:hypothetical protein
MDLHHLLLAGLPAHSGLPLPTDVVRPAQLVRFVPTGDIPFGRLTQPVVGLVFRNLSLAPYHQQYWPYVTLAVTAPAHHHWCQFFVAARW